MKARLLFVLFLLSGFGVVAQPKTTTWGGIDFDHVPMGFTVWRDTISNPICVWQTGKPQKTVFTSAYSLQRVIVTDTVTPYPVNDTSTFYVWQRIEGTLMSYSDSQYPMNYMQGLYYVDSDTLNDYGRIEVSPNNGRNWIDVLKDTVFKVFELFPTSSYPGIRPTLTGRSFGWKPFRMHFDRIADSFHAHYGDTVLMRFTFISDSVQTNRDGLMFDNLFFEDYWEGISSVPSSFSSAPSPNPATSTIHFSLSSKEKDDFRINLYTLHGQKVKSEIIKKGKSAQLSVEELPPGTYYYTITGLKTPQTSSGSVIIRR